MIRLLQALLAWPRPLQIARYSPAPRLNTRRVETRLLRRLAWNMAETVR